LKRLKLYPRWGNTIRCYEDFNWDEEDFDEDETPDETLPMVGQKITFNRGIVYPWFHQHNRWGHLEITYPLEIIDIKLVNDIDYFLSHENGKTIQMGNYKLPTDYDGYMFLTKPYIPWFKLVDYEIVKNKIRGITNLK